MKFATRAIKNSEGRIPKAEGNPNSGRRKASAARSRRTRTLSDFGLRNSFGFRHSGVGFRPSLAGFTLAEVLAAMMFMAIVIPAVVMALRIASRAGVVAARKNQAARIADKILNESIVTTNWNQPFQTGTLTEGAVEFRWTLANEAWTEDTLRQLSVEVKFAVQDHDYSVKMSTLADNSTPPTQPTQGSSTP
jgi:type II secretory pathway pseudopilin PulG